MEEEAQLLFAQTISINGLSSTKESEVLLRFLKEGRFCVYFVNQFIFNSHLEAINQIYNTWIKTSLI